MRGFRIKTNLNLQLDPQSNPKPRAMTTVSSTRSNRYKLNLPEKTENASQTFDITPDN